MAANRISAAVRAVAASGSTAEGETVQPDPDPAPLVPAQGACSALPGCGRCNRGDGNLCATPRAGPGRCQGVNFGPDPRWHRAVPVARAPLLAGRVLASLHAQRNPASWLLVSARWWPAPRAVPLDSASCEWHTQRCSHCGVHEARLVARAALAQGQELTVPRSLTPQLGACVTYPFRGLLRRGHRIPGWPPPHGWRSHSLAPPEPGPAHVHCACRSRSPLERHRSLG